MRLALACLSSVLSVGNDGGFSFLARQERRFDGKVEWVAAVRSDDGTGDMLAVTLQRPGGVVLLRDPLSRRTRAIRLRVGDYPLRPIGVRWPGSTGRVLAVATRADQCLSLFDFEAGDDASIVFQLGLTARPSAVGAFDDGVTTVLFVACDGARIVRAASDGEVGEARLQGGEPRAVVALSPTLFAVGFQDRKAVELYAWDAPGSGATMLARTPCDGVVRDLELVDAASNHLAVACGDASLELIDARAGAVVSRRTTRAIPIALAVVPSRSPDTLDAWVLSHSELVVERFTLGEDDSARAGEEVLVGPTPTDLACADFDGDGRLDFAVAQRDSRCVSLVDGSVQFGERGLRRVAVGQFPNLIVCAELDGDAGAEGVAFAAKDRTLWRLDLEHGEPRSECVRTFQRSLRALSVLDCDCDGVDEVFGLSVAEDGARLELALAASGSATLPLSASGDALLALRVRDRPVVFIADATSSALVCVPVRASRGAPPAFGSARSVPCDGSPVALASLTADGSALVLALRGPTPRRGFALFACDPSDASPAREVGFVATTGSPRDVATGDFDGDGRRDFAGLEFENEHATTGEFRVWCARPDGGFVLRARQRVGLLPQGLVAADFDRDGRDELALVAQDSHHVELWATSIRTDGELVFERLDDLGVGLGCLDLAVGDFEGNGSLGLAVANSASNDVAIVLQRSR